MKFSHKEKSGLFFSIYWSCSVFVDFAEGKPARTESQCQYQNWSWCPIEPAHQCVQEPDEMTNTPEMPLHEVACKDVWPTNTPLTTKLYGCSLCVCVCVCVCLHKANKGGCHTTGTLGCNNRDWITCSTPVTWHVYKVHIPLKVHPPRDTSVGILTSISGSVGDTGV